MTAKNGAMVGATIAFLFYISLTFLSPVDGKSIIPTAHVINDVEAKETYVRNLPVSMMLFISLEIIGMILGVIGHSIISGNLSQKKAGSQ